MTNTLENQSQDNLGSSLAQAQDLLARCGWFVHKQNLTTLQRKLEELHSNDILEVQRSTNAGLCEPGPRRERGRDSIGGLWFGS
ncbi:MAG: hypothetical protein JSR88_09825 [Proteobacteria bacterium]|nr:hypothetical protein [Pseudomonadota bacterium]MBS0328634.1 hypothetical protein [Pseudomonadota bacterium]